MSLSIVNSLDEKAWRRFVQEHPQGNVFHTPEMFQVFERARGHRPLLRAAIDEEGLILALLLPVQVTLFGGLLQPLTTRFISYGGVLCSTDPAGQAALEAVLRTYSQEIRRGALFTELRNLSDVSSLQPVLRKHGFRYEEHLNYLIDLSGSPADVLQRIGARTRKHIRQALRKGTVIVDEICDAEHLPAWYELVRKTYHAARVPLADYSLFKAAFDILQPLGMAQFWLARIDSTFVAASVELLFKDQIYGWYSGVDRTYASETPGELLMWRVLAQASQGGYKIYDFGGAGKPNEKYGVRDFKAKFGGQLVSFGRNTCVHAPLLLRLSTLGYRIFTNRFASTLRSLSTRDGIQNGIRSHNVAQSSTVEQE